MRASARGALISLLVMATCAAACKRTGDSDPAPEQRSRSIATAVSIASTPLPSPGATLVPSTGGTGARGATGASEGVASAQGLTWDVPSRWRAIKHPSPLRKATYLIPPASGDTEDAELSVTRAGGSVEANIKRWVRQFDEGGEMGRRTERTIAGHHATVATAQGTYTGGGMPGEPFVAKTDWALLGAIVETPGGLWFFKMTGPRKTVATASRDFDSLLGSIRDG